MNVSLIFKFHELALIGKYANKNLSFDNDVYYKQNCLGFISLLL